MNECGVGRCNNQKTTQHKQTPEEMGYSMASTTELGSRQSREQKGPLPSRSCHCGRRPSLYRMGSMSKAKSIEQDAADQRASRTQQLPGLDILTADRLLLVSGTRASVMFMPVLGPWGSEGLKQKCWGLVLARTHILPKAKRKTVHDQALVGDCPCLGVVARLAALWDWLLTTCFAPS